MHFIGLGHSHVVALAKGAYALLAKDANAFGEPSTFIFHYLYNEPFEPAVGPDGALNASVRAAIDEGRPAFLLASMGGNEHNCLAIPRQARPFDFILGENPALPLDGNAEILTESLVRETLRSWMRQHTDVLLAIRAATALPIFLVEPPPPLPREQVLAYPKEFFRSIVDRRAMSSDTLRYKMWRAQCGVYRELSAAAGVAYIETPRDTMDKNGMLIRSLCGEDATHANETYGEAMVREALRRYGSLVAETK